MRSSSIRASLLAAGSALAICLAIPAVAQTYQSSDPLAPIGNIITAPVIAAGQIAEAPVAAATSVVAPGVIAPGVANLQSNRTALFVANAMPTINFLNDASRLALERSANPAVRHFAHRLAAEETIVGNSMTVWADATPPMMTGRSAYTGDPIAGLASLPINVVVGTGNALTGGNIVPSTDGRALMQSQATDLSRLSAASGPEFDRLYRLTQIDSLRQLATLYTDYATSGDDPALRTLARTELPKIKMRLAELNRI